MTDVPIAAINAAFAAIHGREDFPWPGTMKRILEAAAPLIAAAERDRIIALASQMRATIPADHSEGAQASFADYLRVTTRPAEGETSC